MTDNELIVSALQPLAIILVFIILFNSMIIEKYQDFIKFNKHPGSTENEDRLTKLKKFRKLKIIPMILINFACVYLYLPLTIDILSTSNIDLWNFDILKTSFMMIVLLFLMLFITQLFLSHKIKKKIFELKKP